MSIERSIVGLTGTNASGKGAAAGFFIDRGYRFYSLSDILREAMAEQNIEETRLAFIKIGIDLRLNHGVDILAKKTLEKIQRSADHHIVVDSFRHPSEVALFRLAYPQFILLCIDAPAELRFERAQKRGRIENAQSLVEFINNEKLESSSNTQAQQLKSTLALADYTLQNQDSLSQLHAQLEQFVLANP